MPHKTKIQISFKETPVEPQRLITDDLNSLIGSDADAIAARSRMHEPCMHPDFMIKVRPYDPPRIYNLSLQTFDPVAPINTRELTFQKTRVILSSGGSFWAWQYTKDNKIYL